MNQEEIERRMREGRNSLKPLVEEETDYQSDQDLKKPQPPLVKDAMTSNIIALPTDFEHLTIDNDFLHVINTITSCIYTTENVIIGIVIFVMVYTGCKGNSWQILCNA